MLQLQLPSCCVVSQYQPLDLQAAVSTDMQSDPIPVDVWSPTKRIRSACFDLGVVVSTCAFTTRTYITCHFAYYYLPTYTR